MTIEERTEDTINEGSRGLSDTDFFDEIVKGTPLRCTKVAVNRRVIQTLVFCQLLLEISPGTILFFDLRLSPGTMKNSFLETPVAFRTSEFVSVKESSRIYSGSFGES